MVMGRRPGVAHRFVANHHSGILPAWPDSSPSPWRRSPCARHSRDGNRAAQSSAWPSPARPIRSFMGYCSSLPIDEFRSIEVVSTICAQWSCRRSPNRLASTRRSRVWVACPASGPAIEGQAPGHRAVLAWRRVHWHIATHVRILRGHARTPQLTVKSLCLTTGWRPSSPSRLPSRMPAIVMEALLHGDADPGDSSSPGTLVVEVWSPR